MTATEMRLAANILSGEPIENIESEEVEDFERLYVSDSDDDSFSEIERDRQNRQQKANELIYNESDKEDEQRTPLKPEPKLNKKKGINLFDMIKDGSDNMEQDDDATNDDANTTGAAFDSEEFNSQVIRSRLAQLEDSDSDNENGIYAHSICALSFDVISILQLIYVFLYLIVNGASEQATNNDSDDESSSNKRERSGAEYTGAASDDDEEILIPQKKKVKLSIIDDDDDDDD